MATAFCGFVIHVKDLDNCRAFYRDVLRLGDPVSDSTFRTEFELASGVRLVLVKAREEETLKKTDGNTALWFGVNDLEAQRDILATFGYVEIPDRLNFFYPNVKCFHDPEGNPFYLFAQESK